MGVKGFEAICIALGYMPSFWWSVHVLWSDQDGTIGTIGKEFYKTA